MEQQAAKRVELSMTTAHMPNGSKARPHKGVAEWLWQRTCVPVLAALVSSGCAVPGPEYEAPQLPQALSFYGAKEAIYVEARRQEGAWWERFDAPGLTDVINVAIAENFQIAEAQARVTAANERVQAAGAALLPQGGAEGRYSYSKISAAQFGLPAGPGGAGPGIGASPIEQWQVGGQASWQLDVFGQLRAQQNRAKAQAGRTLALLDDTRRIVAAETARTYFALAQASKRARLAAVTLQAQEDTLKITQMQYRKGLRAKVDVLRQVAQLEQFRAQKSQLLEARAQGLTALARLMGMTTTQLTQRFDWIESPPLPDTRRIAQRPLLIGNPVDVIRARPDILASERQLAASNAAIGQAKAEFFPQITLTGSAGWTAANLDGIGTQDALRYAVGPGISWNLLSFPQIDARADAAAAEFDAAYANYRDTVLTALTETDQALATYTQARQQLKFARIGEAASREALAIALARYQTGEDSLVSFLDAQRAFFNAQDTLAAAQGMLLMARVGVYRALGA